MAWYAGGIFLTFIGLGTGWDWTVARFFEDNMGYTRSLCYFWLLFCSYTRLVGGGFSQIVLLCGSGIRILLVPLPAGSHDFAPLAGKTGLRWCRHLF
jgi:hypothetical protein